MALELTLAAVLTALTVAVAAVVTGRYIRRLRGQLQRQQAVLQSLERDMQAVCLGARGMGEAVVRLEQKLRQLGERQNQLDLREPDNRIYSHAIGLVRKGADAEELVSVCGLTPTEADLVWRLHGHGQRAACGP